MLDEDITNLSMQERYHLVLAAYLADAISLGRAAELLELPWVDLRTRLHRLGMPIHLGPETVDELRAEMEAFKIWEEQHNPPS